MIASNRPSDIAQNSFGPSNETRGSAVTTPTADPVVSAVMAQRDKPIAPPRLPSTVQDSSGSALSRAPSIGSQWPRHATSPPKRTSRRCGPGNGKNISAFIRRRHRSTIASCCSGATPDELDSESLPLDGSSQAAALVKRTERAARRRVPSIPADPAYIRLP